MSTTTEIARQETALSAETLERLVVHGDMSQLTPAQKVEYYRVRCELAGLDPATKPFEYLKLPGRGQEPGKEILYANKTCTDQLSSLHKLDVRIVDRQLDRELGIFTAQARVRFPGGREVDDIGVVSITWGKSGDLFTGDTLANALMKAVTKAKRRAILSACGLGELDETEVETIPGAVRVEPAIERPTFKTLTNDTGHGKGLYAPPAQAEEFKRRLEDYVQRQNARWIDSWTDEHGEIPAGIGDIINVWQLDNHLVKWAKETGRLEVGSDHDKGQPVRLIGRYTAILFNRSEQDARDLKAEMDRYVATQAQAATEKYLRDHPEPESDDGAEPDAIEAELVEEPGADDDPDAPGHAYAIDTETESALG